jgi:3-oxoacyl-[acyl-carrier-protein] synthase II
MNESVVVTGIGIVSAAGIGLPAFESSLREGRSGIGPAVLTRQTGEELKLLLGTVKDDVLPDCVESRRHLNFKHMSRSGLMVCAAASLATKDGKFSPSEQTLERTGIVTGTAFGGMQSMLKFNADVRAKGPSAVNPIIFPDTVSNAPAGYAAIAFGMLGMNATLSTGFSSGLRALRVAHEQVASGNLAAALAGGYDELIPDLCVYWKNNGSLSKANSENPASSFPFDEKRNGFYPAEGAVMLLLERRDTAEQRGADIYGELLGFGSCQSSSEGAMGQDIRRCTMQRALSDAKVQSTDIAAVFASANGSVDGDREEALAIRSIFGAGTPVTAIKAYTGECMAASGPASVVAALMALRDKVMPNIPGSPPGINNLGERKHGLVNSFGLDAHGESIVVSII